MHLRPFVTITQKPDAVDRVLSKAAAVVLRYTYAQTTESVSGIFVPATGESQLRVVVGPVQALFPAPQLSVAVLWVRARAREGARESARERERA